MNGRAVTIIVVSRGLYGLLRYCLTHLRESLRRARVDQEATVVLVDNASPVPYRREVWLKEAQALIRLDTHHSFSAANNLAAKRYPSDCYLLLNNDVLLNPEALSGMFAVLDSNDQIGVCGTRLIFPDGSIQHAGVVFGDGEVGPYHKNRGKFVEAGRPEDDEFQAVTGACMLIRRGVWEALEGLDEAYAFGLEDVDFCLRARRLGWRAWCHQGTESLHFESMTPGRVRLDVGSRRLFMNRWKGRYSIDG